MDKLQPHKETRSGQLLTYTLFDLRACCRGLRTLQNVRQADRVFVERKEACKLVDETLKRRDEN